MLQNLGDPTRVKWEIFSNIAQLKSKTCEVLRAQGFAVQGGGKKGNAFQVDPCSLNPQRIGCTSASCMETQEESYKALVSISFGAAIRFGGTCA